MVKEIVFAQLLVVHSGKEKKVDIGNDQKFY